MAYFDYGTNQAAFDAAFGGLTAFEAADLILKRRPLTAAQREALDRAAGNGGYRLRFNPAPVGHVDFVPVATRGTGNAGWLEIIPATPECRRIVNAAKRSRFAAHLGEPRPVADRLWHACRGYAPVLAAAAAVWPLIKAAPNITDRTLREAGFRPRHPHEGAAIEACRLVAGGGK